MRRLPIYLLLDVSGSMSGEPIATVENGIQMIIDALTGDPNAIEVAHVSVITFADRAQQVVPLTELNQFAPPRLKTGGTVNLGNALKLVTECANREVIKTTSEVKGDWKPLVFIMTNGAVNGDIEEGLAEFKKRKWGAVVACAAGADADLDELKKITDSFDQEKTTTAILKMDAAETASYAVFFLSIFDLDEPDYDTIFWKGRDVIDLPPPPEEIIYPCLTCEMKKHPIYFVVDLSGGMVGEPLAIVENQIQNIISYLKNDPRFLESTYLSVITFSDYAQQIVPLTHIFDFELPPLIAGGLANFGEALKCVSECADREVNGEGTETTEPDERPIVIIMATGNATDDFEAGLTAFNKRKWEKVIACWTDSRYLDDLFEHFEVHLAMTLNCSRTIYPLVHWAPKETLTFPNNCCDLPPPPDEVAFL